MDLMGKWPVPKFHFRVSFDMFLQISFQEVSGLEQEAELLEYRHGASKTFSTMKRAGMFKTSNLSLKKGIFKPSVGSVGVNSLFQSVLFKEEAYISLVLIELLDEKGYTIMGWAARKAVPIKVSGVDFKSDGNEVAIESLDLAVESVMAETNAGYEAQVAAASLI